MDDADASSEAIAMLASGAVTVFGAAHYVGTNSFYASTEVPLLKSNTKITSINHMLKDAKKITDILAKEDKTGKFTYIAPSTRTPSTLARIASELLSQLRLRRVNKLGRRIQSTIRKLAAKRELHHERGW